MVYPPRESAVPEGGAEPSGGPLSSRPDVLVIVLDCVRASDFPGGSAPVSMPFVERLRQQSVAFPRAVSVAPWTLPSHASLFTGLYPWEHGCHGRGSLRLDPQFVRLAQLLRAEGYRSLSLSGNPIISPFYGLVDGFGVAEWGEWWEQVHRLKSTPSHVYEASSEGAAPDVPKLSRRDRMGRTIKTMLTRVPSVLALGDGILRRTVDPDGEGVGNMNPWVEPELSRWFRGQPAKDPTFCFINLVDAHEPYLLDPAATPLGAWWRSMRIAQDVLALLVSPTPPPAKDLERLHDLYRNAIAVLDRRLERIVEIYQEAGRWQNTLLLLTSDHGQAFGEHGMIWHGVRTDEEMLRVPLLLRLPGDELAGATGIGWASPMDAAPTILEAAGVVRGWSGSGISLRKLVAADRPVPLLCAGDGTEWNRPFMEHLTPQRRSELNVFSIAAYVGPVKIVVDATTNAVRGYDLSSDPPNELSTDRLSGADLQEVLRQARGAAAALLKTSPTGVESEAEERLRSWGYG